MGFNVEQSLALAVILQGIEDYNMPDDNPEYSPEETAMNRQSASVFFANDSEESLYSLYADILGVQPIAPDEIAENLKASNRRMVGSIKKSAMVQIVGQF